MNCSPFDLRDYFFDELPDDQRRQVAAHVATCAACCEELDRLRLTQAALLTLRDEEIPQRIGFVSDRVYEPSALRRRWRAFWGSAPRLGFASAAMLSLAILFASLYRPATPSADLTQLRAEIQKAVAESEARQAGNTAQLLAAANQRYEEDRSKDRQALDRAFDILEKTVKSWYRAANYSGDGQ